MIYSMLFRIFTQIVSAFFRIRCGESETQSAFENFKKHSALFVIVGQLATVGIFLTEFEKSVLQIRVVGTDFNDVAFFVEINDSIFLPFCKPCSHFVSFLPESADFCDFFSIQEP